MEEDTDTANARVRILVVEDDLGQCSLFKSYLLKNHPDQFEVTCASDLKQALEKLKLFIFDAVLLDLALPDSKGRETFDKVNEAAPESGIVILTALGDEETGIQLVKDGAQDFLPKLSLDESLLSRAVLYAVERKRLRRALQKRTWKLEETIEDLEEFSYTITHDLRAPLRAIAGFADLIEKACSEDRGMEIRDSIQRIKEAADRMDRLIRDVLCFTRVAQGVEEFETVDVEKVLRDVVQDYAAMTLPHVELSIERPLHPVTGSHVLLVQCLANLLENSVKFVAEGGRAQIRIWTEKVDGSVRVHVQDSGIGIPPEFASKIFSPFQRGHANAGYEGTGIGLAIVKKAVAKMHGTVSMKSEVGKGTTFTLEFPEAVSPIAVQEEAEPVTSAPSAMPAITPLKNWKVGSVREDFVILLVEDEQTDAVLLQMAFKKAGLSGTINWVKDGMEAIEYLEGSGDFADRNRYPRPSIIILDLKMPRVTGLELLAWLRQKPEFAMIPTVVLSSSQVVEDVQRAYELGANSYMVKPVNFQGLSEMLKIIYDHWKLVIKVLPAATVEKSCVTKSTSKEQVLSSQ
jgi:signal transduction histidine kinase